MAKLALFGAEIVNIGLSRDHFQRDSLHVEAIAFEA
jgi:hypothetical protein